MNILIVEDDSAIAGALESQLPRHGYAVQWVRSLAAAAQSLQRSVFQAMILDLGLPDGDGLAMLARMRLATTPLPPTIITTARHALADRIQGLNAGADDYLVKPFELEELVARLRAVMRRAGVLDRPELCGSIERRPGDERFFAHGEPLELSRREFEVFVALWERRERLVTRASLLRRIDPAGNEVGDAAIEVYVHRLRRKLEGTGVAIQTLRGFGYLLRPESC